MNPIRAIVVSLALLAAVRGAGEEAVLLTPGAPQAQWSALFAALGAKGTVFAPFTERRFFPFRREPTILKGLLRFSADRGLSLQYTDPEPSVLIADSAGLLIRDRDGRSRELPAGSRESGAIASLLPIMRFDLQALYPRFAIRAQGSATGWRLAFTPDDAEVAESLGEITVEGAGTDVSRIGFRRSASQRIEIDVGATRSGQPFTPDELRLFFR
jgi:hypothetical protein